MITRAKQPFLFAGALGMGLIVATVAHTAAQECNEVTGEGCVYGAGIPGQVYDSDWDGISDTSESYFGTDPYDADTDRDGIRDGDEYDDVYARSDPTLFDTDGDGIGDGYEVFSNNSDPMLYDTDGDGAPDSIDGSPRDPFRS
ncbi:MAG: hypothetical protein M3Z20_12805 [Chloroflexota bacterium]|nr:hypothetical protein [Chloroflexota bacterium]